MASIFGAVSMLMWFLLEPFHDYFLVLLLRTLSFHYRPWGVWCRTWFGWCCIRGLCDSGIEGEIYDEPDVPVSTSTKCGR